MYKKGILDFRKVSWTRKNVKNDRAVQVRRFRLSSEQSGWMR